MLLTSLKATSVFITTRVPWMKTIFKELTVTKNIFSVIACFELCLNIT